MSIQIRIDPAGVAEVLRSREMAAAVDDLAEQLADQVRAGITDPDIAATVDVDSYLTDRAAAAVTIAHPAGLPIQAKHGTLTAAASALGLDVRSR
ncbi:hypothetical protein QOZ88_05965 [Blastococcus sp. BMG 814]|uniref:Uncharacterized protein n=1 Tax=Blastococcus carthaginiensis TaxID=3050034 RepID=A0ABT9I9C6_9ACTN|nr:hypothetical protein [Blastococcus carthaginiensis]MDP5182176.1 hypothetical protein [Blastococcus carthaginiensis]